MFTRCTHCRTTFRITGEALEAAAGQVRCGRCMQVFDATAALAEELSDLKPDAPASDRTTSPADAADDARARAGTVSAPGAVTDPPERGASVTDPAGRAESGEEILFLSEDWRVDAPEPAQPRRRLWAAASVLAVVLLAGQLVHHFRNRLIEQPVVGEHIAAAYTALGIDVVPRRDPDQYRIRDWIATADQSEDGRSSLVIRAEIGNRGPGPMPQPHIYLALMDRWDAVVASRIFAPEEYLADERTDAMMSAGASTVAELEVVDPGPEASGFEIDVCVPRPGGGVQCANDDVFR